MNVVVITLAPKKLIRTRLASEGSASEPVNVVSIKIVTPFVAWK